MSQTTQTFPVGSTQTAGREEEVFSHLGGLFSAAQGPRGLEGLLAHLGESLRCHRAYIYEFDGTGWLNNTDEWCAPGVLPQKEVLQQVPEEVIGWWQEALTKGDVLVLEDVESIRTQHPLTYGFLKPQGITSLVASPIWEEGRLVGYLGLDNPNPEGLPLVRRLLGAAACFAGVLMKQQALTGQLDRLEHRDSISGLCNRRALGRRLEELAGRPVGIIFVDLFSLKRVNNVDGYQAGDALIARFGELLRQCAGDWESYRIGGDDFLLLGPDRTRAETEAWLERIRLQAHSQQISVTIAADWTDGTPTLEQQIAQIEQQVKGEVWASCRSCACRFEEERRLHRAIQEGAQPILCHLRGDTLFQRYLQDYRFEPDSVIESLTMGDFAHYLYFGDMEHNCFYISDNMRDAFGFSSNLVYDLLSQWEERIATPEFLKLYQDDIAGMLAEKRTVHDLRYQVRDAGGNVRWIHCCGILRWNEERTRPVFFSGSVSYQDDSFIVDPVTNFPREHTALDRLGELESPRQLMVFSLNHFTEINETKGRYAANQMLRRICDRLARAAGDEVQIYRLDGLKFLAIPNTPAGHVCLDCVGLLREVVGEEYQAMGITVDNPCSCGLLEYPNGVDTPHSLVGNAIILVGSARQQREPYLKYCPENIQEHKRTSNLALTLSENVLDGMKHFRIVIQPVVSAQTGQVMGGEVLLRWQYEEKEVSPGVFIPLMEKGQTIQRAGKWVLEQTVRTCRRLIAHNPDFYLTFNVSYHQIMDDDFVDFMEQTVQKYQVPGGNLVAELTETHYDEFPEKLRHFVERCSAMGIRVALDDFGNAYSSLGLLLKYPASIVKLDRSLLVEMSGSEDKVNFISSIVYACHRFGKKVCMEGVETQSQHEMIVETGCDLIQGFYHFRPMEVGDVYQLVSRSRTGERGEGV